MPHDRDAELACIAACLAYGREAYDDIREIVGDADAFFVPAHAAVFRGFEALAAKGEPIGDPVALAAELRSHGQLEMVGGARGLDDISRNSVIGDAQRAARAVAREAARRRLVLALRREAEAVIAEPDISVALHRARATLDGFDVSTSSKLVSMAEAVRELRSEIERFREGQSMLVPMGFPSVDEHFGKGLEPGELLIVAAESGEGKTAYALSVVSNGVLVRKGNRGSYSPKTSGVVPALVISGEMGVTQLVKRWVSDISGIDGKTLRSPSPDVLRHHDPELGKTYEQALKGGLDMLGILDIWVTRPSQVRDMDTVCAVARSWRAAVRRKYGHNCPGVVLIDYLQLMGEPKSTRRNANRDEVEGEKAKAAKGLAQDLEVPVIALSQVTLPEIRKDKRPDVSDLRGSKAIRHAADGILLLHRPWAHAPDLAVLEAEFQALRAARNRSLRDPSVRFDRDRFDFLMMRRNFAEAGLAKVRGGSPYTWVPLEFLPEHTRFLDSKVTRADVGYS